MPIGLFNGGEGGLGWGPGIARKVLKHSRRGGRRYESTWLSALVTFLRGNEVEGRNDLDVRKKITMFSGAGIRRPRG